RFFDLGKHLSLKVVVGDGRQELFVGDEHILGVASPWATDLCLRIWSETPNSAIIHRAAFRPITAEDIKACGWTAPPTEGAGQPEVAAARLGKINEGRSAHPTYGSPFKLHTTGTPMQWIRPGMFEMGSRDPKDEGRHRVQLTHGFWIGQIEVTQGDYSK